MISHLFRWINRVTHTHVWVIANPGEKWEFYKCSICGETDGSERRL